MKKFTRSLLALLLVVAMVLPNLVGIANAAPKPSADVVAEIPSGAQIFFQSEDEAYSFNTATYWDIYQTQLGVPKNTHAVDTTHVNYGLTLASSTDAALVSDTYTASGTYFSKAETVTLTSSDWGKFSADRYIEITGVPLDAGDNDIKIAFTAGADIQTLSIVKDGAVVESLAPTANNVNYKKADNSDNVKSATDTSNGYIDLSDGASYKTQENCLGWMQGQYAVYHFAGTSADGITAGTYTLRLQYAGTETSTNVTVTVNEPVTTGGHLRIDYESAWTYKYSQYSESNTSSTTVFNYTDGTGTAVGWGGNVKQGISGGRSRMILSLKVVNGADLATLDDYMKIYLVDLNGNVQYETTLAQMAQTSFIGNGTQGYTDFQNNFNPGYITYVTPDTYNEDEAVKQIRNAEGMKIVFEAPEGQMDISGTIEIGYVGLYTGTWDNTNDYDNFMNKANWTSFGPFDYDDAVIHPYTEYNKALNYVVKPFLRRPGATTNQSCTEGAYAGYSKAGAGTGTKVSGSNISNNNWHLWTMSTSDANIVSNEWADKNGTGSFNALEIKYQKNGAHETTASLTRASTDTKNGQWLAITVKGEDLTLDGIQDSETEIGKIKLILNKGSNADNKEERTVSLNQFKTAPADSAPSVDMEQLNKGYQTLYYHIGEADETADDYYLYSVDFDFSDLTANAGNDAHRIYVKEIYLYSPTLVIEKSVSRVIAHATEEVLYTLTVYNESNTVLTNCVVSDTLDTGVTLVAWGQLQGTQNGQTLTWTIPSIGAGDHYSITFTAAMPEDAKNGDMVQNRATVQSGDKTVTSNTVTTTIEGSTTPVTPDKEYVFFAEVGQKTTLNIDDYTEQTVTGTAWTSGGSGNTGNVTSSGWNSAASSTKNVSGFTFRPGWNKVIVDPTGTNSDVDHNMVSVTLKTVDGTSVGSTTASSSNCVAWSTWANNVEWSNANNADNYYAQINTYLASRGDDTTGFILLPKGKNSNAYFDTSNGNNVIGDVNNEPVVFMVYVSNITGAVSGTVDYTFASTSNISADITVEYQTDSVSNTPVYLGTADAVSACSATRVRTVERASDTSLYYTPATTGTDSFNVPMASGNYVKVTVYNFDVADHLYVLDYGLPVELTSAGTIAYSGVNESLLNAATAKVGTNVGAAFVGVKNEAFKSGDVAETADYQLSGTNAANGKNGGLSAAYTAGSDALTVTYTPTRFMDSADTLYYGVQVSEDGATSLSAKNATPVMQGKITVIPATSVYYEDNFASSGTGANGDNGIIYSSFTKVYSNETVKNNEGSENDTTSANRTQSNSLNLNYGYDDAYATDDQFSGETATELQGGAYALFEFWGTGFDIISHTATDTGTVHVYVYSGDEVVINGTKLKTNPQNTTLQGNPKPVASMSVNTYYENNGTEGLYQIPVISKTDLTYGKYVVKIAVSTNTNRAVEIDGIRIYNPAGFKIAGEGEEKTPYDLYTDSTNSVPNETDLEYQEIRALVLGTSAEWKHTVKEDADEDGKDEIVVEYEVDNNYKASLLDCKADTGEYTLQNGLTIVEYFTEAYNPSGDAATSTSNLLDYASSGPNNELYLGEGYAVAFAVQGDNLNQNVLQIGAKAVKGSPTIEYLNSKGEWTTLKTLSTATEMYYELNLIDCYTCNSQRVVVLRVAADSANDDVVSLTKVKIPETLEIVAPSDKIVVTVANADA